MNSINDVVENKINGLHYGNRLLLPFHAHILKIVIDDDIITDFSNNSKFVEISYRNNFMEIYFLKYKDLTNTVSEFENIKMIVVDDGKDIFDPETHEKIALYFEDAHKIRIEKITEDILFIE